MDIEARLQHAIQSYWDARSRNKVQQVEGGKLDSGNRSEVTGGSQMGELEVLTIDILAEAGLKGITAKTRLGLELPGFFRPEKNWDLLVVANGYLLCALEFKSLVGPSFGNNFNNRSEEAIGNAVDVWTAYREGLLGKGPRPFLGYFFLLEDCPKVHRPVRVKEPHFKVDEVFRGASYARRCELLCRRLVLERNYDASCLVLATRGKNTQLNQPAEDLSFKRFVGELRAVAERFKSL